MKKLIIAILICMTTVLYSQSVLPQVESNIALTEFQKLCYDNVTEGCQKIQIRIVDNNLSCPVFIDENGWTFFITMINNKLQYITVDRM